MSGETSQRDLVIVVADKDMEFALRGLLSRPESFGIRQVDFEIYPLPGKDPGCRNQGVTFLRTFRNQFAHALLIFDHDGSGDERRTVEAIESELEGELHRNGWSDRAAVIVIEPELEVWVWSDSSEVDQALGWAGRIPSLRSWLADEGLFLSSSDKPDDPKEALHRALREVNKKPSSSLFSKLAKRVGLRRCQDRAFGKLQDVLKHWYSTR